MSSQERSSNVEQYKQTDSLYEGKDRHFMTLDAWNQDGNYYGREDEFGPVLGLEEAPPTHNGKPIE